MSCLRYAPLEEDLGELLGLLLLLLRLRDPDGMAVLWVMLKAPRPLVVFVTVATGPGDSEHWPRRCSVASK